MKTFFVTILCMFCLYFSSKGQNKTVNEIKEIILEDLLLLNSLNNYSLINKNNKYQQTNSLNEIVSEYTYEELNSKSSHCVNLLSIDTLGCYKRIMVKFIVGFNDYNLSQDTFEYLIYDCFGEFYKINGFVCSDILRLRDEQVSILNDNPKWIPECKKICKLHKSKSKNINSYLYISILYKLFKKYHYNVFYNPLLRTSRQVIYIQVD